MEPLKEMFNKAFYQHFATVFAGVYKKFEKEKFVREVTAELAKLELNQRLRNTSVVLQKYLPGDYQKALAIIYDAAPLLRKGYTALVMPDYVGLYGKDHFDISLDALKYFTVFGSSEFAVREFIRMDHAKTLKVMNKWAEDENVHVRRLASEGSRPRLPWSFRLDAIIKKPELTKSILEKLRTDKELYVKKSVANHLNDISKDNPEYMLKLVKSWDHSNADTKWIIKHASRNLIKKGDKDSLAIFDFEKNVKVNVNKLKISSPVVRLGEELQFEFEIESQKNTPQKLVVDYAVHYFKARGVTSKKIFKLKEITLKPGQKIAFKKTQMFKDLTTRKHHSGKHMLEILVNGKVMGAKEFKLVI